MTMTDRVLAPHRPWARMKRKPIAPGPDAGVTGGWRYSTSSGTGREHATDPVSQMNVPQGCDQCAQVVSPGDFQGARSFRVSRGLKPTTLYLCGRCVEELCAAGNIPPPEAGA